jgi:hypothetical protein
MSVFLICFCKFVVQSQVGRTRRACVSRTSPQTLPTVAPKESVEPVMTMKFTSYVLFTFYENFTTVSIQWTRLGEL